MTIADNGYGVVRRCAGHGCDDRNRCLAHVAPVAIDAWVIWMPWYDDRKDDKCPHFVAEEA